MTTKITNDNVTSMDAGKLTGSLPGGMAPETDLSSVRSDILKLALHQAVDGNRVAFNLEDSFVDGFEDDAGITTETTVDRNTTGEYVSAAVLNSVATLWPYTNFTDQIFSATSGWNDINTYIANQTFHNRVKTAGTDYMSYHASPSGYTPTISIDYKASYIWSKLQIGFKNTYAMIKTWRLEKSDDGATWTVVDQTGSTVSALPSTKTLNTSPNNNLSVGGAGVITNVTNNGNNAYHGGTLTFGNSFTAQHLRFSVGSYVSNSNANAAIHFFEPYYNDTTYNATGTLISDPQTASTSRTSASGVIIYEDAAGTNTLGTDLKIYFSCNNSAWTEAASYGTATTYSGTKKLVKLGATNCTAGTSVAMKAVWANQSASKEARLHGWAVNY